MSIRAELAQGGLEVATKLGAIQIAKGVRHLSDCRTPSALLNEASLEAYFKYATFKLDISPLNLKGLRSK